jgi:hypothetical protein
MTTKQDMRELGRKGGLKRPETELREVVKQDEEIRVQAQDVIRRGLAGDESVTKTMLDAARSVFSFRAAPAPEGRHAHGDYAGPLNEDGSRPTSLADVLAFGLAANESTRAVIEAAIAEARARTGGAKVFERWNDASLTANADGARPLVRPSRSAALR